MPSLNIAQFVSLLKRHWPALLLGVLFFCLYTYTLSPGVLPADSGEFQIVVPVLGVAHPPGFSLYILLGKLFSGLVRVGSYAYRLNLFSAFTSALTLILVCVATNRLVFRNDQSTRPNYQSLITNYFPGLLVAVLLGLSTTFWSQATTANIRSLMALLTALAVYAFIEYALAPSFNRFAFFLFSLSLAVVHHLSIAFIALILFLAALGVTFANPASPFSPLTKRTTLRVLVAGLAPLLVLLYLPIRGAQNAYLAPPGLDTFSGFLQHALGLGFGGDFFYFINPVYWPDRFAILANIFQFQFNDLALILLVLGLILFFFKDWKLAAILTLAFAVHCFVAITYRAPQTVEYLLPAYVILVVISGAGLAHLGVLISRFRLPLVIRRLSFVICYLLFFIAAALIFLRNLPAYQTLSRDNSTHDYAAGLLISAPPDALILAAWHQATPLWYLQLYEGLRPDVEVRYVYPQGTSLAQNWVDEINANAIIRPTLVTSFYPAEYAALPYRFLPILTLMPAWQASPDPLTQDGDLAAPTHEDGWMFGSGSIIAAHSADAFTQNETFYVQTFWQAPKVPTDINFFVQLIGPDGLLYGQADVFHPASKLAPNETISDRLLLTVNTNAPAGNGYSLVVGAYLPDGRRLAPDFTEIAQVAIVPSQTPPVTRNPQPAVLLAGYDYDLSIPDSPRLYLHWRLDGKAHTVFVTDPAGATLQTVKLPALSGYLTTSGDLSPGVSLVTLSDGNSLFYNLQISISDSSRYVSFGPLTLVGSSITKESDGSYRVDLDWQANQPITDDFVVKVDLVGEGYAWRDQSDSIPARGAIPTLKWIPGIIIHDRHRLKLLDATPATFQLAVYDHFTLRNLPILDSRLAQLGPTVPLGTVQP